MGVLLHQSRGIKRTQGAFSLMTLMLRLQRCKRNSCLQVSPLLLWTLRLKDFPPTASCLLETQYGVLSWNHNERPPAWFIRERREGWMAELPNLFEECMDWFPRGPWVFTKKKKRLPLKSGDLSIIICSRCHSLATWDKLPSPFISSGLFLWPGPVLIKCKRQNKVSL